MIRRRSIALGAVFAVGLGGLFTTSPALAQETPPTEIQQDPLAQAAEIVAQLEDGSGSDDVVTGYGVTTAGEPIVLVDTAFTDAAVVNEIVTAYGVESIALVDKPVARAQNEVVGGAGYLRFTNETSAVVCSTGFSAWTPNGDPAVVTAGHCSGDGAGTDVFRTLPSLEPGFTGADGPIDVLTDTRFGSWGFSQYGGPGNTPGAADSPDSTDVGVIDLVDANIIALPAVTDWTTAGSDDLAASTTAIKGVAAPQSGTLSKSGRTTGLTSGSTTVELLHTDGVRRPVEILDGYMEIDNRWVRGFLGGQLSASGDSGGAVFQGDQAVGIVSGGPANAAPEDNYTWSTRLVNALDLTGGYTVMLDIDAPGATNLGAGSTVEPGDDIVVEMPNNATALQVTDSGSEVGSFDVVDGSASFAAPASNGTYSYTLTATNGYSASAPVDVTFEVKKTTPRPEIFPQDVTAASGATTADATIAGTGIATATVTVTGVGDDREVTTTVEADGSWQIAPETLPIGAHNILASQSVDGESSAASSATFTIAPAAPTITSITPDQAFGADAGPTEVSGEGLPGATVALSIDPGQTADDAPVTVADDGSWTAPVTAAAAGKYLISATQTLATVSSDATSVSFSVGDETVTPVDPTDPVTPVVDPNDPSTPGAPGQSGPDGQLPDTGGVPVLPLVLGATFVALLGAGILAYAARRKALRTE